MTQKREEIGLLTEVWRRYSFIFHMFGLIITITTIAVMSRDKIDAQAVQVTDHEMRIRTVENSVAKMQGELHEIYEVVVKH